MELSRIPTSSQKPHFKPEIQLQAIIPASCQTPHFIPHSDTNIRRSPNDGDQQVQREERPDGDEQEAPDERNPGWAGCLQLVQQVRPVGHRQHLEHRKGRESQVVE